MSPLTHGLTTVQPVISDCGRQFSAADHTNRISSDSARETPHFGVSRPGGWRKYTLVSKSVEHIFFKSNLLMETDVCEIGKRNASLTFLCPSLERIVESLFNVQFLWFMMSLPHNPILWKFTICLWKWSSIPMLHSVKNRIFNISICHVRVETIFRTPFILSVITRTDCQDTSCVCLRSDAWRQCRPISCQLVSSVWDRVWLRAWSIGR